MAASTLAASSLLAAPSCFSDRSSLASSSSFVDSSLRLAPLKPRACRAAISSPKCSLTPEEKTPSNVGRHLLAGVVATSAALAVFANASLAFSGPGGGVERTAQKADELLKSGDKLNFQDASKKFGDAANAPVREAEKVAQNAGGAGGAISDLQEGIKSIFGQTQDKKSEIDKSTQDAVGQSKNIGSNVVDTLQDRVQGVKEGVQEKNAQAKDRLEQVENSLQ